QAAQLARLRMGREAKGLESMQAGPAHRTDDSLRFEVRGTQAAALDLLGGERTGRRQHVKRYSHESRELRWMAQYVPAIAADRIAEGIQLAKLPLHQVAGNTRRQQKVVERQEC